MQMAISRSREFEADRGAAELLGTGQTLATALEKIEVLAKSSPMAVAPAQAQAYIHNPLAEMHARRGSGVNVSRLFSTHPATDERIRRLRAMTFESATSAGPLVVKISAPISEIQPATRYGTV